MFRFHGKRSCSDPRCDGGKAIDSTLSRRSSDGRSDNLLNFTFAGSPFAGDPWAKSADTDESKTPSARVMVPGFISKPPRASPPQDNSEKPTRVRVRRTQLPRLDGGKGAKIQREGRLVDRFSRVQNSERIENRSEERRVGKE